MIRNSDRDLYVKLSDQVLFIIAKHWKIITCPIVGEWLHKSLTCCSVSTRNNVYKRYKVIEKYVRWSGNHLTPFEHDCLGWELFPHSRAPLAGNKDPLGILQSFFAPSHTPHLKGGIWSMGELGHSALPLLFLCSCLLTQRTGILDFPICRSFGGQLSSTAYVGKSTKFDAQMC